MFIKFPEREKRLDVSSKPSTAHSPCGLLHKRHYISLSVPVSSFERESFSSLCTSECAPFNLTLTSMKCSNRTSHMSSSLARIVAINANVRCSSTGPRSSVHWSSLAGHSQSFSFRVGKLHKARMTFVLSSNSYSE